MSDTSSIYSDTDAGTDSGTDQEELDRLEAYEASRLMHTDDLSSDDEEADGLNTIGRVPLHWYDAYDHIGYDIHGKRIIKRGMKDRIDQAIDSRDNPNASRTLYDMYNDREIVLTDRELEIIRRVQAGAFAHPEFEDTPDYVDYFSSIQEIMPLSQHPDSKKKYMPSKWEKMRIQKIVEAMKDGKYVSKIRKKPEDKTPDYLIWNDVEDEQLLDTKRNKFHLPAPKMPLPGHAESYNPPPEVIIPFDGIVVLKYTFCSIC